MNFLSIDDQLKVQRLPDLCQENEVKDGATQTEQVIPDGQQLKDAGSQTCSASEAFTIPCNCQQEVLRNQAVIKNMLEKIMSNQNREANISSHNISDISNMQCTLLMSEIVDPVVDDGDESASPSAVEPDSPYSPNGTMDLSSPQLQQFENVFKKSSFMANFAKNLVFELFKRDELVGKNCAGVKGKQGIGNDPRMELVQQQTFKKYRVTDKNTAWNVCRKAIDTALRKMKY